MDLLEAESTSTALFPEYTKNIGPVGEIHFSCLDTSGVSLQQQLNIERLRDLNVEVYAFGGDIDEKDAGLLDYQTEKMQNLRNRIRVDIAVPGEEEKLLAEITDLSVHIEKSIEDFLDKHGIRVAHVRNVMSLPYLNLPATFALRRIIDKRTDIYFILQHHDLNWEGPGAKLNKTPYDRIRILAEKSMLPKAPNVSHIVINTLTAHVVKERFGIDADVVPDGFDFNYTAERFDDTEFRHTFKIGPDDLVAGMMTRIRTNKDIEAAIQFVSEMNRNRQILENAPEGIGLAKRKFNSNSKIILLLPQSKDLDDEYFIKLQKLAAGLNVNLLFIGHQIISDSRYRIIRNAVSENREDPDKLQSVFPFYSCYQLIDFAVYTPYHEGFGNQAIEAAWAKKLLVMHLYPVAKSDIVNFVRHLIPLGDNDDLITKTGSSFQFLDPIVVRGAVLSLFGALINHDLENSLVESNFEDFKALCDVSSVSKKYLEIYLRYPKS